MKITKHEMMSLIDYLESAYGTKIVDDFLSALWLGISDTAHYELFFDALQKARLEHGQ